MTAETHEKIELVLGSLLGGVFIALVIILLYGSYTDYEQYTNVKIFVETTVPQLNGKAIKEDLLYKMNAVFAHEESNSKCYAVDGIDMKYYIYFDNRTKIVYKIKSVRRSNNY